MTDTERLAGLRREYRPYDTLPAFDTGYAAYGRRSWVNPFPSSGYEAQAWDRGLECAARFARGDIPRGGFPT